MKVYNSGCSGWLDYLRLQIADAAVGRGIHSARLRGELQGEVQTFGVSMTVRASDLQRGSLQSSSRPHPWTALRAPSASLQCNATHLLPLCRHVCEIHHILRHCLVQIMDNIRCMSRH